MRKTLTIFVLVLIVVGAVFLFSKENSRFADDRQSVSTVSEFSQDNSQEVTLVIDNGLGQPEVFETDFFEGMTAFDLLKEKTNADGTNLKAETFDIGTMVQAIGEVENGERSMYWLYYVNNEMPPIAVDKNEIASGDIVEFKFEKSPF